MIYLASPYSSPEASIRDERFEDVCVATAKLVQLGELVFSPIAHSHPLVVACDLLATDYDYWKALDEHIIRRAATKVYVLALPGWRESKGVAAGVAVARQVGIPVFLLNPADLSLEPYPWHES